MMPSKSQKKKRAVAIYAGFGVVLAALTLYIVLRDTDQIQYVLPEVASVQASSISGITIESADRKVELAREGENWLVGPEKYRADPTAVESMVRSLAEFAITDLVSTSGNVERYQLDQAGAIIVEARDENGVVRSFAIGKRAPSYNHTYVLISEDSNIYHAATDLRRIFEKDTASLRDKSVFAFDTERVVRVGFSAGGQQFQVFKPTTEVSTDSQSGADGAWRTSDGGDWEPQKVMDVLSAIDDVRCLEFTEGSVADLGQPLITVEIETDTVESLTLYSLNDDGYIASSTQNPYVFVVAEGIGDRLLEVAP